MKLIFLCSILMFISCVSSKSNFRNTYYGKNSQRSSEEITESTIFGDASFYGQKYQGRKTANGELFDMYGKLIKTANNKQHIDLEKLATGLYIAKIHSGNNIGIKKVIKNKNVCE